MIRYQQKKGARYNTDIATLVGVMVANLTANVANSINLGGPHRRAFIEGICASCLTVPVDADGTLSTIIRKWDKSAGAYVTLTSAVDLKTLVSKQTTTFPLLATLTQDQRELDVGDTLTAIITSNSAAIDTQPVGLVFNAELAVID